MRRWKICKWREICYDCGAAQWEELDFGGKNKSGEKIVSTYFPEKKKNGKPKTGGGKRGEKKGRGGREEKKK